MTIQKYYTSNKYRNYNKISKTSGKSKFFLYQKEKCKRER